MDIQALFADRIGGRDFGTSTEIYKFEKIKRAKDAAREARPDVELLDFGVGEPDQMAPAPIREALKAEVDNADNRGYADNGVAEFKQAAADYMSKFFGVSDLDPATEINHSIGSKPALAMLPIAFINPGDVVFMTVPGYPVLATHASYLGAEVVTLPLLKENGFLPDLKAIDPEHAKRAKLFYINYPNNPTGAAATPEFYDEIIAFAKEHNILVVQDAAYATLTYEQPGSSILARPGGKDVAIELHSMSKSYNMTGWRLGFVAGDARIVNAYATVKDNTDSVSSKQSSWQPAKASQTKHWPTASRTTTTNASRALSRFSRMSDSTQRFQGAPSSSTQRLQKALAISFSKQARTPLNT